MSAPDDSEDINSLPNTFLKKTYIDCTVLPNHHEWSEITGHLIAILDIEGLRINDILVFPDPEESERNVYVVEADVNGPCPLCEERESPWMMNGVS